MVANWAQFVYEDLARIGAYRLYSGTSQMLNVGGSTLPLGDESIPLPCCAAEHPECMAILTDTDDEAYRGRVLAAYSASIEAYALGRGQCLPYSRSFVAPRENCSLGVREQGNLASSFLDASHIYGSNKDEAASLRDTKGTLAHRSTVMIKHYSRTAKVKSTISTS